ncbi:MAG: tripartite tricarboxylate transporter substrate binding protein [Desulfovibrio sp.]|jgi:tripartite-type tricarboxylate transporter receptor subunit TctC|nr:tripartite tricarboxylate transporter substrate binding protein [Desulfovibrio sp.]
MHFSIVHRALGILIIVAALVFTASLSDAKYPERPINVIIAWGAGGAPDTAVRIIGEDIQKKFGTTLINIPKPGGGGAPSTLDLIKARPDGYTFCMTSLSVLAVLPQVADCGFTINDFQTVAQTHLVPQAISVATKSGIRTFQEFIQKAKVEPGKYTIASFGPLSGQRLFLALCFDKLGVDIPYISYDTVSALSAAMLKGEVTASLMITNNHLPFVQSGEFTLLAVTTPKRLPEYPDVPTTVELIGPEFSNYAAYGIIAPKKTPKDRIEAFQAQLKAALEDPSLKARFEQMQMPAAFAPAEAYKERLDQYYEMFGKAVNLLKIKK